MEQFNKIMEYFWLSLTVVSLLICFYFFATQGFKETYSYLVFPFMTVIMFAFRRSFRKRMERNMKESGDQNQ
jgi:hypothetical protein